MKIISICRNDWANLSYNLTKAMRTVGMDANCFTLNPHPFDYEQQAQTVTLEQMRLLVSQSDIINFVHSDIGLLNALEKEIKGKKIIVTHTGSAYRNDPEAHNAAFNPHVYLTLTDHCEFMQLGAKNIHYKTYSVAPESTPHFGHEIKVPYIIGHYPSNPEIKGTKEITSMLSEIKKQYNLHCATDKVHHQEQLKRMNDCDIYIELFKPELNGRPYGHYGVTAFEAAAAGKVVITQNLHPEVYAAAYGNCELYLCNTRERFMDAINTLLSLPPLRIAEIQTETYKWVSEKHSFKANGERLKKLILQT